MQAPKSLDREEASVSSRILATGLRTLSTEHRVPMPTRDSTGRAGPLTGCRMIRSSRHGSM
ncbi:hypothetical protein CCR97_16225 [Rhodoplanes elegans]|uniref:Uncharacterized protein n=1 Tax=Rhodoplanes elegans TaxID=29408 RepID=A0A327KP62_9BRAD|nr:hypothetical protein [Rhodoplanes elegans]RAI39413.1 hypothetical protein CH338_09505 [Rhodoplanes elegans]